MTQTTTLAGEPARVGPSSGRAGVQRTGRRVRRAPDGAAAAPAPPPVCLYTPSADPSGMGQHMVDLAECYTARGGSVTLMAWPTEPGKRLLARAGEVGATPVALPHPRDPCFAAAITSHLRRHPVEVFHVHVGTGRENFDGARAARAAGVPAVVQTLHLPWMLAGRHKRASFFTAIREVDHLLSVSEGQRRTYLRIGLPPERLSTVPNGVRPRRTALGRGPARRELGLDPAQPVVMTLGRLAEMKGQRYLVECLPRLVEEFPGLAVVVVGSGHLHDALEAQARTLGVSGALRLVGHRPDGRALLDAADVFTLPSLHEGMPLAVMEAMEAGLPVVGTRVTGTAEVVAPGLTGLLVPPRDAGALGEALAALLRDPARRLEQGAAGRRRYQELFTADLMATRTIAAYQAVLGAVGGRGAAGVTAATGATGVTGRAAAAAEAQR